MESYKRHFDKRSYGDQKPHEDRLVMLCDGVFAIATTLLVLDIKIPPGLNEGPFNQALLNLLSSSALFYLVTFIVIASYWIQHRRLMHLLKRLDARFSYLTFLFLAFIAFFPVTSTILSEGYGYRTAVILYTLSFSGCGFSLVLLWLYASWNHRLIEEDITNEEILSYTATIVVSPLYFSLSLLLLFTPLKPSDVFWVWLFIPLIGPIRRAIPWTKLAHLFPSGTEKTVLASAARPSHSASLARPDEDVVEGAPGNENRT